VTRNAVYARADVSQDFDELPAAPQSPHEMAEI
jgi:hypothetical protein